MTLKRVIDADKICADQLFLRESASAFRRYLCPKHIAAVRIPANPARSCDRRHTAKARKGKWFAPDGWLCYHPSTLRKL